MHFVGSAVLAARATPSQRERYLVPISRGEHLTTLALSEPGTGVHFYLPETRISAVDGGYELTGIKSFVTSGGYADSYVISAAPTRSDAAPGEFSCVVVRRDTPGLTWDGAWHGWGMRGNAAASARLDNVRVPADDLLGEEGDEIWFVFNVVAPFFLMAMSGTYLGIAAAAFEAARAYLGERRHSHTGAELADNAIVQHRIGTM
jgi:alkylation response protein AidB-like acyl-CoA dehydrogenase